MVELGFGRTEKNEKRAPEIVDWNRDTEALKAFKKSIRSAKRSWKRFCQEINSLKGTSKLKWILLKNVTSS